MEKDTYKAKYLQESISMLTEENLELLEKHCIKNRRQDIGRRFREHEIVFELIQAYKEQQAELEKKDKVINKALEIAFQYAQIDGDHHKAWVIDQIVRSLTGEDYTEWVKHYEYDEETGDEYTWSEGIAP